MFLKISCLLVSIFVFNACSSVPYNPRRSVEIKKKWYAYEFKQGGNRVDMSDLADKIARNPKHKEEMKSFSNTNTLSKAMMLLGGFGVGWSLGGGFDESTTLIASILLAGGGYYLDYKSKEKLIPLIKERNQNVYLYKIPNEQFAHYKRKGIMLPLYSRSF